MIGPNRIRGSRRSEDNSPRLEHGDVTQHGRNAGVVIRHAGDRVLLWPIQFRAAEVATDVSLTNWMDLALVQCGTAMVQAGRTLDVPVHGQRRAGKIAPATLERIEQAAARHADTMRVVKAFDHDREHRRDDCQPSKIRY